MNYRTRRGGCSVDESQESCPPVLSIWISLVLSRFSPVLSRFSLVVSGFPAALSYFHTSSRIRFLKFIENEDLTLRILEKFLHFLYGLLFQYSILDKSPKLCSFHVYI